MMLARMAFRNVERRARRTIIIGFAVGIGLLTALMLTGIGTYNWTRLIDVSATMGLGHVAVEARDYNMKPSNDKRLPNSTAVARLLSDSPGVSAALPRVLAEGMVSTASKSVGASLMGIDPGTETADTNFFLKGLREGSLAPGGAVVGAEMARKLNLRIGKKLVYTTTGVNGEIVSEMARVSGIFRTGIHAADGGMVLLHIDALRRTLGFGPDEATLVAAFLRDHRSADALIASLRANPLFAAGDLLSWKETQPEIAGNIAVDRASHIFMQFFIGLLVAAGILDTILMSVLERKHEFGVMLAVGASPGMLFRLVLMESFFLGLVGLGIGAVLNIPFYIYLSTHGIDLTSMVPEGTDLASVPIDAVYKVLFYAEDVAGIAAGVFTLTLLAGLYPALKASRVPPVESMRAD